MAAVRGYGTNGAPHGTSVNTSVSTPTAPESCAAAQRLRAVQPCSASMQSARDAKGTRAVAFVQTAQQSHRPSKVTGVRKPLPPRRHLAQFPPKPHTLPATLPAGGVWGGCGASRNKQAGPRVCVAKELLPHRLPVEVQGGCGLRGCEHAAWRAHLEAHPHMDALGARSSVVWTQRCVDAALCGRRMCKGDHIGPREYTASNKKRHWEGSQYIGKAVRTSGKAARRWPGSAQAGGQCTEPSLFPAALAATGWPPLHGQAES
eukprot:362486-Chlamydomonas_euryale.AAC.4